MDAHPPASRASEGPPPASPASILGSLRQAESATAFLQAILHHEIERARAVHGAVWLPARAPEEPVRLVREEPTHVRPQAAEAWRRPLSRRATAVFGAGAPRVARISEPADRLLEGHAYWCAALPVPFGRQLVAAVTLVVAGDEPRARRCAQVAADSIAALASFYATLQAGRRTRHRYDELCRAWDLVASANAGYPDPEHMALALVNKAKEVFAVQRVSLGWYRRGKIRLAAISERDHIDRRSNLARALAAAMEEGEDPVQFPPPPPDDAANAPDDEPAERLAGHAALADLAEDHAILTHPLRAGGETVAVAVLERREPRDFTEAERRLQSIVCDELGPAFGLARQNARGALARCRDGGAALVEALMGKGHVVAKLLALAFLALLALAIFGRWTLTVSGSAVLAPAQRRVYAAPFDRAVLKASLVLPGQRVDKGAPICRFETEELDLELREARAKLAATQKQMDVHFSAQKVAEYKIAQAQRDDLAAHIELLEHRIARAEVRAAFDGVVLAGDLRQQIGRPFQMGETLLEVAPLDELLLLVEVDQSDVAHVALHSPGTFATKARPDVKLPFVVEKIRPMSETRDRANIFVVEARIANADGWLLPGMEAAASIRGGRHNIAWVLSRKLVDWLRYQLFL